MLRSHPLMTLSVTVNDFNTLRKGFHVPIKPTQTIGFTVVGSENGF